MRKRKDWSVLAHEAWCWSCHITVCWDSWSQHYSALTSLYTPSAQWFLGQKEQGQLTWVITESRWDSKGWTGDNLMHLEFESAFNENKVVSVVPACTNNCSCCCS